MEIKLDTHSSVSMGYIAQVSVGSHQCSCVIFLFLQVFNMETSFFVKCNYHRIFHLRAGGDKKCPYSQYFPYSFFFCEFPRLDAARSPAKSVFCSQVHNYCGEAGGCRCAGPCSPDWQIQDSTKGILSFEPLRLKTKS